MNHSGRFGVSARIRRFRLRFEELALAGRDVDAATVCISNRLPGERQADHVENFQVDKEGDRHGENRQEEKGTPVPGLGDLLQRLLYGQGHRRISLGQPHQEGVDDILGAGVGTRAPVRFATNCP
jgi:hypothetical protein